MSESSAASGVGTAGGVSGSSGGSSVVGGLVLTDEDLARFQAGLKKCLNGVTQIKVGADLAALQVTRVAHRMPQNCTQSLCWLGWKNHSLDTSLGCTA